MLFLDIVLILAGLTSALMAGLFYAFSIAVNRGLEQLNDMEFVKAMQFINSRILNPLFFLGFLGAPLLLLLATVLHGEEGGKPFVFLLAATVLYLIGVFGVTVVKNVPMNTKLGKFIPETASEEEISGMRTAFEKPWTRWNHVRTVASCLTVILVLIAIYFSGCI
ncbi:anthrone oxygenase family protein [Sinomicrobium sp. M5D2P17]